MLNSYRPFTHGSLEQHPYTATGQKFPRFRKKSRFSRRAGLNSSTFNPHKTMPRTPLGPISGNRPKGPDLTPYQRGIIMGQLGTGVSPWYIQKHFKIPESTVRYTRDLDLQRYQGQSIPREGRPKILSERDRRKLIRIVRREPKTTYRALKLQAGLTCCQKTLYRELEAYGLTNWRAKKRPLLTPEVAAKRLI